MANKEHLGSSISLAPRNGILILEPLALVDSTFAIQIDSAESTIASCVLLELNNGHCQALQSFSSDLSGNGCVNADIKTIADSR